MIFDPPDGATPLDIEETRGLKLHHITNRGELNRWEQLNIAEAEEWAFHRTQKNLLSEEFARRLHKKMFGTVWKWAGSYRITDKNIGVHHWEIRVSMRQLIDDANAWFAGKSYVPDEFAARFHHRLVFIHPFSNGNGRHARLMADLILVQRFQMPRFTWGSGNLIDPSECRARYIAALKSADQHDNRPLIEFVRS